MTRKKFAIYLLLAAAVASMSACGNDEPEYDEYVSSSTAITGFSLLKNDKVLENLDSVFFTVDLDNFRIYNADSLPYGTDVSRIQVSITSNGCKAMTITQSKDGEDDVVVDYLKNSTDSIDFTKTVKLTMTSINGLYSHDYSVKVNVHQVVPDSMEWALVNRRQLPTRFGSAAEQRTVEMGGTTYCLTRAGSEYCMAASTDLLAFKWTYSTPDFGMTPQVNSLTATDNALYILSNDGGLYSSADGLAWTSCPAQMTTLIAGYGSTLLGLKKEGSVYYHVTYPATVATAAAADFPVSGMSQAVTISNSWSEQSQALIIGGRCADSSLTGAVWGFDGKSWACLSNNRIPAAEGVTIFPYFSFKTYTNTWKTTKYSALIAFGGRLSSGKLSKTVYISLDNGINWKTGDSKIQLPDYVPAMWNSQAIVNASVISRHSSVVTEWECPFVYLFGGQNESSQLINFVWRGVINRLEFKPVI